MEIKNIDKNFKKLIVFHDLSMKFEENSITCILGPSGCGKTTLLNIISGLTEYDSGQITGFGKKTFSYIFEEPRLLPWKTVFENIDFALSSVYSKNERKEKIEYYLEIVGLSNFKHFYPHKLSGGMAQRVSVARAFAYPSDVLLMDEPFKKLDFRTRVNLIESLLKIWALDRRTIIFVTHSIDEAVLIGNKIYVLSSHPVEVKKTFPIDIDQLARNLQDKDIAEIKKEILVEFRNQ